MSLTFKDYKINQIALLFIKLLTQSKNKRKFKIQCLQSIEPITRLIEKWRNSSLCFCLVRLILDSCSINRNQHSIGRKEFLIDRDSHNWIFQESFLTSSLFSSIKNTFWFYQWRFTDQTLGFSISRSRTIIMLETLKT